jgi:CPA2 family monovalent cation:H+ antiporter-2
MSHLPTLITDLALILGAAGITTFIFRRLKQPVVLGYILSGLLVGPNFSLLPTVTDLEGIKIWADIGVIFLLFALGLEFSFKKLAKVGTSAGITGIIEISMMMLLGYTAGVCFGWSTMDSLFLGGIIAISSTTIIFRAFEELGIKTKQFTSLVLGVLIMEDLVAVVLMVLLSTMALSNQFAGTQMLMALGKLLFFLTLWFVMGIFLLPTILKKASKWLSSETLLVGAIALCLGMVVFADRLGFSAALGAFVMGSILSETVYGEKIEHLISSVKNLFGAVFFVSVGMLIDPVMLWKFIGPVLMLSALVILGKLLFVSGGALVAGRPLKQAVEAGTSMTQIGEFSFIIATLGVSLQVTSDYLYPIAVGVSVLTTFTTPFLIRFADPLHRWLNEVLPQKWLAALNRYSAGSQVLKSESDWKKVFAAYGQLVFINITICIAFILLSSYYLKPYLLQVMGSVWGSSLVSVAISLGAMLPFIWAMAAKKMQGNAYKALWLDSKYNHGPLVTLEVLRNLAAVAVIGLLIGQYFPLGITIAGTVVVLVVVLLVFRNRLQVFYHRLEERFLHNLHAKEMAASQPAMLAPWDAHLSTVHISPASNFIGRTLEELQLREQYGINIAFIQRGSRLIYAPARTERLFPHDEIGVIGTDVQLQKFTVLVESEAEETLTPEVMAEEIILQKIIVDEHNQLRSKTIRSSRIRENTNGLVVGIERGGERILNPSSFTVFEWEDVVWLVGDRRKILKTYFQQQPGHQEA